MGSRQQPPFGNDPPLLPSNSNDPRMKQQPMPIDKITDEERKVLKECERESFIYRGLPASAGLMVAAQYLVKTGRLAAHPKFGSIPKTIIFGFTGYMLGKISYMSKCQQKILDQIPNSNLADTIRRKHSNVQPSESDAPRLESESPSLPKSKDDYNAFGQTGSDYKETTEHAGIDDRFRPTIDKETPQNDEKEKKTTYEELRRKNRQQYEDSRSKQPPSPPGTPSYKDSPLMPQKPWPNDRNTEPRPQDPPKRKRTNIWGDAMDE